jgi:hypothetical protein
MSVRREDKDVGGSPSSVMDKGQHWHKNLRATVPVQHDSMKKQRAL